LRTQYISPYRGLMLFGRDTGGKEKMHTSASSLC
jgi:hypothetical protein